MRIVHVVRQFAPGIGGLEDFVGQLARRQVAAGHDVRVVTLDRVFDGDGTPLPARESINGVAVQRLRWRGSRRYPIAPGVFRAVRGADLVHVHALDFFHDFLALTRPLHRRPMIFSTHGLFFHTPFAGRGKKLWFRTITRALTRAYAAVAASSAQDAERMGTIRSHGVVAVENGVDLEKFRDLAQRRAKVIIYFGRLAPNKRVDLLIDWFASVAARDPDWRLIIAGKPMGVSPADLLAQAGALGLGDRVEVYDTPSDEQLRALVARASVYACASDYEGFGLAAVEAASAGLFLALSPIPPFRRTLDRIGHGAIVDFADRGSADAFLGAWTSRGNGVDGDALDRMFGWAGVAAEFEALYGRALGHTLRRVGRVATAVLTADEADRRIAAMIASGNGGSVGFCNQHTVNIAATHADVAEMLDHSLVLADGVALDAASKLLYGRAFPENLNGSDYVPELLRSLPPTNVFLLGSPPGVAERAMAALAVAHPQHRFMGCHHGFPSEAESATLVRRVNDAGVELLLVGMGHPHQERWVHRWGSELTPVTMCVGAFFDFAAGAVTRAPAAIRKARMEWAYRMWLEPRRMIRRYISGGAVFGARVLAQKWRGDRV